jgi:Coenzyme PQQ synthesis protein D (PqqD)
MVQEVDGQTVLLDIQSGQYFSLNRVGRTVWDLCDGTRSVSDIIEAVCTEYDVPKETASQDADALLESLAGEGLVVEA